MRTEIQASKEKNGSAVISASHTEEKCSMVSSEEHSRSSVLAKRMSTLLQLQTQRWFILLLFASYSMSNAYQWIHLNIIGDKVLIFYNASMPESTYAKVTIF